MLYFSHSDYQNADDDITYDGIGNPLSYFNGKNYLFAWKGRSLASATFEDNEVSYEYNSDGIRTSIYDAWGNFTISYHNSGAATNADKNNFTYRGYYYDRETGFYYLNSRYYDPATGRFLNADGYVSTGQGLTGYNMYAYCGNNPVNRVDPSGVFWKEIESFFQNM